MTKPKRRKRPNQLHNYRPDEISLVDEGANGKRILITKRANMANAKRKVEQAVMSKLANTPAKTCARIEKSVKQLVKKRIGVQKADDDAEDDAPQMVEKADGLSDQAQAALEAFGRLIAPYANEITTDDVVSVARAAGAKENAPAAEVAADAPAVVLDKADDDDDTAPVLNALDPEEEEEQEELDADELGDEDDDFGPEDDDDPPDDAPTVSMPDETPPPPPPVPPEAPDGISDELHDEAAAAARAAYASTLEAKGYRVMKSKRTPQAAAPRAPMGKTEQALLQRIEKRAIKMERVNKALEDRNAKLEKALAVERDARLQREYEARAKSEFALLGEPERIAKCLRRAKDRLGDEGAAEFEAILKSAHSRLEAGAESGEGLFGEIGSRLGDDSDANPLNKLEAMADEVVQKSASAGTKTRSQAYRDVLKSPEGRKAWAMNEKKRRTA